MRLFPEGAAPRFSACGSWPKSVHRFLAAAASIFSIISQAVFAGPQFTDADWISLGGYAGGNGFVYSVATDPNSGAFYIGGRFTIAGRTSVNSIAMWDGTNWTSVGGGFTNTSSYTQVSALATDGAGNLYAGGYFNRASGGTMNGIARWNGTIWSPVGLGLNAGCYVAALALDAQGSLYAAGIITNAGGVPVGNIARWDGTGWYSVGSGINNQVRSLAADAFGNIYAGGYFTTAGNVSASCVARWDGKNWSALGSGVNYPVIAICPDRAGGIYAGGSFSTAGGVPANGLAHWDGVNWSAVGSSMNVGSVVETLTMDSRGNLYAGGFFTNAGGVAVNNIARWDGTNWSALDSGINDYVVALSVAPSGRIYAGGFFNRAGSALVNGVAGWDGSSWSALISGMAAVTGPASGLVPDRVGNLFIGSIVMTNQAVITNTTTYLEKWDGTNSTSLSAALAATNNVTRFYSMTVGQSNTYFVGGSFTNIGGHLAQNVAEWTGTNWRALGSGCEGPVYAMTSDGLGNVYAGGSFYYAGNAQASNVAKWDGTNWSALGSGVPAAVQALTVDGLGNLYAASVTNGGLAPNVSISSWNGTNWQPIAAALSVTTSFGGGQMSMAVDSSSNIYVGALNPIRAGGITNFLVCWNGTNWSALGSSVNGSVTSLAYDGNGHLFVGGGFTTAGTNASPNLAEAIVGIATNPPTLNIANFAGGIELSWPLDHTGWRLQSQRNLPGAGISSNWFTIANSTNVNATNFPVNPGAGSVFYRLVFP